MAENEKKWIELLNFPNMEDRSLILIAGNDVTEIAEKITERTSHTHPAIENRVGKDDLRITFQRISNSKLLVSNDSGPQHFAMAVRTPVVTIFGSTIPEFGFYPVGQFDEIVETDLDLNCRPCGIHGRRKCPIKTFDCMNSISVDTVIAKIQLIESKLN